MHRNGELLCDIIRGCTIKKTLIILVLTGLLVPGIGWAARAVYWVPLPDCFNEFICVPPETAHCRKYLIIGDHKFHAPIGVKVIEKHAITPNKEIRVASEFFQNEGERIYSMEELGVTILGGLLEIVLDLPLPTDSYVLLIITNRAGDLDPPASCYEGLPITIPGIKKNK